MFKRLFTSSLVFVFALFLAAQVNAASTDISIRIEQPKSPTNQDNFNLVFVTLDIQGRAITAKCFKKGPSDGSFAQFGADIAVTAGGNTGNCPVSFSIMNTSGTYQFYATATAGSDTATSTTDSVDFNTSGPGTPSDFSKDRINSCQYKVSYKTADDSGKTVKVELYRSENQTFSADSGTRVDSHAVGSNVSDSFTNGIPDCSKSYFYVLRAFDTFGNGSGLVGDASVTVITTGTGSTSVTTTTPGVTSGAIPVGQGQVLGEETSTTESSKKKEEGEVKGEETEDTTPTPKPAGKALNAKSVLFGLGAIAIASLAFYLYRRSKKV